MYKETRIGTTVGIATSTAKRPNRPEQVYVYLTNSPERPIAIEGWVGYGSEQRIELTANQAAELMPLLMKAAIQVAAAAVEEV